MTINQSQCAADSQEVCEATIKRALTRLMECMRDHDTDGTAQLKRFVWSLWNGHHQMNIYSLGRVLDGDNSEAVAIIFVAYMRCMLKEDHIRWVLVHSGEMRRFEQAAERARVNSDGRPVDYPPTPESFRRHCLELGPISGGC